MWGEGGSEVGKKEEVKEKVSKRSSVRRRKQPLLNINIYTVRVTHPTYPTDSLK
jgi:hypothetical protein